MTAGSFTGRDFRTSPPLPKTLPVFASSNMPTLASSLPELSTLVVLLRTASQLDALDEGVTLFAPSNDALRKFRTGAPRFYDFLTDASNRETLAKLLRYHMLPDRRVLSDGLKDGVALRTLDLDSTLYISVNSSGTFVRDGAVSTRTARVTQADVLATNCVMHIVDEVLVSADLSDMLNLMWG